MGVSTQSRGRIVSVGRIATGIETTGQTPDAKTGVPSERWTAQQVLEAVGPDDSYHLLLTDRDVKYGEYFVSQVASAGLKHVVTAPGSPW